MKLNKETAVGEVSGGPMSVTFGSLFAGIGGFDLGFERAGLTPVFQVEIDPYCQRVLAKHWPTVARYGDIREVHGRGVCPTGSVCDRCLPDVDVLCGGFPCQDISVAGKGVGIDGARSGLWAQFDRLIGELRPRYVVVENVSALLVRGLGRVLGDLAARGYDAEWDCIPASAVGAPHRRDRLWLVAYAAKLQPRREHKSAWVDDSGHQGSRDVSNTNGSGRREQRRTLPVRAELAAAECRDWWRVEPNVGRVVDGLPGRVDRLRGLGNAVVPQITELIGRRLMEIAQ